LDSALLLDAAQPKPGKANSAAAKGVRRANDVFDAVFSSLFVMARKQGSHQDLTDNRIIDPCSARKIR
jgi:hypothetical protein